MKRLRKKAYDMDFSRFYTLRGDILNALNNMNMRTFSIDARDELGELVHLSFYTGSVTEVVDSKTTAQACDELIEQIRNFAQDDMKTLESINRFTEEFL